MSKLTVTVTNFRRFRRGTLCGFCTVYVSEVHLTIYDIAVHRHASGAHWRPCRPSRWSIATAPSGVPATAGSNTRRYSASTAARSAKPSRRPSLPRCSGFNQTRSTRS